MKIFELVFNVFWMVFASVGWRSTMKFWQD